MPKSAVALFLVLTLVVQGCNRAPSQEITADLAATDRAQQVLDARWREMFANPEAVVRVANELGYNAHEWSGLAGEGHGSRGGEQVLPRTKSSVKVVTTFAATGSQAQVDAIEFNFEMARGGAIATKKDREALKIPKRIVGGFLSRFGLSPGDDVRRAIANRTSVDSAQQDGLMVVRFRPGANPASGTITVRIVNARVGADKASALSNSSTTQ